MYGYVFEKRNPPPELVIALDWQNFHTPYAAGGLRDQPLRLFRRMKKALNIYNACMAWKQKPSGGEAEKRWYVVHQDTLKVLEYIWEVVGE